jgi:hypothetical protein
MLFPLSGSPYAIRSSATSRQPAVAVPKPSFHLFNGQEFNGQELRAFGYGNGRRLLGLRACAGPPDRLMPL